MITWTTGQVVTAAQMNSTNRDLGNFVLAPPLAILRQTVAQSIPNNTYTSLTFDTEDIDRDNAHSTSSNTSRYTSQTQGYYDHDGNFPLNSNATGQRALRWAVNATAVNASEAIIAASGAGGVSLTAVGRLIFLNVGDFSELQGFQNSGVAINTLVSGSQAAGASIRWRST